MEYQEALKQAKVKKPASNPYLLIEIDYNKQFILPYKAGIAFLESLQDGQLLRDRHTSSPEIKPIDVDTIEVHYLSEQTYQRYKIAQLMQLSYRDVEDLERNNSF